MAYVDGLRGVCALYVVIHHAFCQVWYDHTPESLHAGLLGFLPKVFFYGHLAVGYFIVISGYCLFRHSENGKPVLAGGFWKYAMRRARRVIPPYYAALILYIVFVALLPDLQIPHDRRWDEALPIFDAGSLLSHFLLVHPFKGEWLYTIDPPMWSIGIEWWIYWLVPISILPVWRKFGAAAGIFAAGILGIVFSQTGLLGTGSCPHYLLLFTFGMLVAQIVNSNAATNALAKMPWLALALVSLLIAVQADPEKYFVWSDLSVGVSCSCLLLACAVRQNGLRRILESRILIGLGAFSYSLYLCHWLVVTLVHDQALRLVLEPNQQLLFDVSVGVPASLVLSYGFYLLFEKPFLSHRDPGKTLWIPANDRRSA